MKKQRDGLLYYEMINRLKELEEIDHKLNLIFLKIVDRYNSKYNKNIFYN
jgi:hypothetical protein